MKAVQMMLNRKQKTMQGCLLKYSVSQIFSINIIERKWLILEKFIFD